MITQRLENLAEAIKAFEGWRAPGTGSGDIQTSSRSYRNHNPGNLRASPFAIATRDNFAVFLNDNIGMFSLLWDLWAKCTGRGRGVLTPDSTLEKLIERYSGETGEVLENYILFIEKRTGMDRNERIGNITNT